MLNVARRFGVAPCVQGVFKRLAFCACSAGGNPFGFGRNHDRGGANFNGADDVLQVRVGKHHAAVGRQRRARELVGRCAVQPDATAGLAAFVVQHVGVVDGQGARTVKVFQRLWVQVAGDVVDAQTACAGHLRRFWKYRLCPPRCSSLTPVSRPLADFETGTGVSSTHPPQWHVWSVAIAPGIAMERCRRADAHAGPDASLGLFTQFVQRGAWRCVPWLLERHQRPEWRVRAVSRSPYTNCANWKVGWSSTRASAFSEEVSTFLFAAIFHQEWSHRHRREAL